jgi:outer membrane biosynthesis protein TonB
VSSMEQIPTSVLALPPRTSPWPAVGLTLLFHAGVFSAAFYLPRLLDKPPSLRKPIIAHMVALGKPRDKTLLPRKESAPPAAATAAAASVPGTKASTSTPGHVPSRRELMERALARAAGRATEEKPDEERAGQKTGSPEGTAESAEAGDAYFTAVHDAILEHYVVPSVISERERLYLSATVLAYIGKDGNILKHDLQKKSGNLFFDQALEVAIQRAKLPPPPPELAKQLRDGGVVLNFRP